MRFVTHLRAVLPTLSVLLASPSWSHPTTILEGTPIKVKVVTSVGSGDYSEGSPVPMAVAENIVAQTGEVLIEQGTPVVAIVEKSDREGVFGKPGSLTLTIKSTTAIDGGKVLLAGQINRRGKNGLGFPANPVGLLRRGGNVKLAKGTQFTAIISEETEVDPGKDPRRGQSWEILLKNKKYVTGEFVASEAEGYRLRAAGVATFVPLKKIKTYRVVAQAQAAPPSPSQIDDRTAGGSP